MKHLKCLSTVLLMVIFLSTAMPALADTLQQDGLEVNLETNQASYDGQEAILATFKIKNVSTKDIPQIVVRPYASAPYQLTDENDASLNIGFLSAQEEKAVQVSFSRQQGIILPETGDSGNPLLWMLAAFAAFAGILFMLRSKKGMQFFSLLLIVCMVIPSGFINNALAGDENASLVIEKTVYANGVPVNIGAVINYGENTPAGDANIAPVLTANQTTLLVNQPSDTVYFYVQSLAKYQSAKLMDATGKEIAPMADDGQYSISGDDLVDDGIFSCKVNISTKEAGIFTYYALLKNHEGKVTQSNPITISVVSKLTDSQLSAIDQVHSAMESLAASNAYQQMSLEEKKAAIQAHLDNCVEAGTVVQGSVRYDTANQMYSFLHASGVMGGMKLTPFNENLNGGAIMTREERDANALLEQQRRQQPMMFRMRSPRILAAQDRVEIGNAVILYAFDDTVSSSRYSHYLAMAEEWGQQGLNTYVNTSVTIQDLKALAEYQAVVFSMHGVYHPENEKVGAALCLMEEVTEEKNALYSADLKKHNLATVTLENGKTCYWVYASFFEDHYGANALQNTFIFSEACSFLGEGSQTDTAMADALEKAGAAAVIGFHNPVHTEYSRKLLAEYMNQLLAGETAYTAMAAARKLHGQDDSAYTGEKNNPFASIGAAISNAVMSGNIYSQLVRSGIDNGSFEESASPSGWKTTGDVRVLTRLSSLQPQSGSRMAILTTGIGSAESSYLEGTEGSTLSQQLILPLDSATIQFKYDVVSEEPMEYVGSQYDDKFILRLLGVGGKVLEERTLETINQSKWYAISGIDFDGGDETTYHTQWRTVKLDVSAYRGQLVTLQFVVYDVGDSLWDTAALIDEVQLTNKAGDIINNCDMHLGATTWTAANGHPQKSVSVSKHDDYDYAVSVEQLDPSGNALNAQNKWLTATKLTGGLSMSARVNYGASPRTARVIVTCGCGNQQELIVTQLAGMEKPSLRLLINGRPYDESDVFNEIPDDGILNLSVLHTNAQRLYIRIYHSETGESAIEAPVNQVISGSSTESPVILKSDCAKGRYIIEATVSNSNIANDPWSQKTIERTCLEIDISAKRKAVIARAEQWLNYTWETTQDLVLWNTSKKVPAGSKVRGIPYSSFAMNYPENSGGKTSCLFSIDNTYIRDYSAWVDKNDSRIYTSHIGFGNGSTKKGPAYGAECTQLVADAWYAGDKSIGRREMKDNGVYWSNVSKAPYVELVTDWTEIQPADIFYNDGHRMMIIAIDDAGTPDNAKDDTYTVIEQSINDLGTKDEDGYYIIGTGKYSYSYQDITADKYQPYCYTKLDE